MQHTYKKTCLNPQVEGNEGAGQDGEDSKDATEKQASAFCYLCVYPTQRTFVFFIDNAILIQVPTEDKKDGEGEEGESKKASEANEESKKVDNSQMINLTS